MDARNLAPLGLFCLILGLFCLTLGLFCLTLGHFCLTLQVVLWMRETMRHDWWTSELSMRPRAVTVYADYLKDTKRWDLLERLNEA